MACGWFGGVEGEGIGKQVKGGEVDGDEERQDCFTRRFLLSTMSVKNITLLRRLRVPYLDLARQTYQQAV
jgi:hypothetical protein